MDTAKPITKVSTTTEKAWIWVTRAWETCPTDMKLHDWYQKFREELHTMYTAQAENQDE